MRKVVDHVLVFLVGVAFGIQIATWVHDAGRVNLPLQFDNTIEFDLNK